MDSINSWINEDEVRKLAEDLTAEPQEKPKLEEESNDDVEGFAFPEKQGEVSQQTDEAKLGSDEVKATRSSSLASASAKATSVGLIGKNKLEIKEIEAIEMPEIVEEPIQKTVVKERVAVSMLHHDPVVSNPAVSGVVSEHPLCDQLIHQVPMSVSGVPQGTLPVVHPEKELGTFEQIDQQLTNTVKANGICVIDRDGDVLYSSIRNPGLVSFAIETVTGSNLMETESGEFGNIRMKMTAGEFLEFVSVKSTRGVLILVASMENVLGNSNAQHVAGDILDIANAV